MDLFTFVYPLPVMSEWCHFKCSLRSVLIGFFSCHISSPSCLDTKCFLGKAVDAQPTRHLFCPDLQAVKPKSSSLAIIGKCNEVAAFFFMTDQLCLHAKWEWALTSSVIMPPLTLTKLKTFYWVFCLNCQPFKVSKSILTNILFTSSSHHVWIIPLTPVGSMTLILFIQLSDHRPWLWQSQ